MKTLIIYGSKHGCTEFCAKQLKDKLLGEVTIVNIQKENSPDLKSYENIIIGGSIYVGKIQKEISNFCNENLQILKNKKIGLFTCGMNKDNSISQLESSFPKELVDKAVIKECFGGEFIFKKLNFMERLIVRVITKNNKDVTTVNAEKIQCFAQAMNRI